MKSSLPTSTKSSRALSCVEHYGTAEQFLLTFNPSKQYKYCQDIARCYTGKAPTIHTIAEAYGDKVAESWIEIQLKDLSEFTGCKDKLTIQQIDSIAQVIMFEFPEFKVTELMHFFIQFKAGRFGKFYGAVDGLVITEALQEFRRQRNETVHHIYKEQAAAEREQDYNERKSKAVTYEEYKKLISNNP